MSGTFAAVAVTLYVAHHVGDYWVQTDHQAQRKGTEGHRGRVACLAHVASYTATQSVMVAMVMFALDLSLSVEAVAAGLAVSAVTHYAADRREHGLMFRVARQLPGKAKFMQLGLPFMRTVTGTDGSVIGKVEGTPSLGTGMWALDQSWHIFWGVFVAGLVMTA